MAEEGESGDFNKVAAVSWSRCGAGRSSRDISILSRSRERIIRGQIKSTGPQGGEGAGRERNR